MRTFWNRAIYIIRLVVLIFFAVSITSVIIYKYCPVAYSPLMFIRCIEQMSDGEQIKLKHRWVPIDSISPHLPLAVMAGEDQNFNSHNGFDFVQIKKVISESKEGGRLRGASTISQQVAKNVFLWPSRDWVRKGLEVYYTVLIEVFWSKERIMEVYLNTIEMGDGIYGAEAVAREHFNKPAMKLTRNQCAMIAVSLPNPIKFNSSKPTKYMYKRQTWIIRQMKNLGSWTVETAKK